MALTLPGVNVHDLRRNERIYEEDLYAGRKWGTVCSTAAIPIEARPERHLLVFDFLILLEVSR